MSAPDSLHRLGRNAILGLTLCVAWCVGVHSAPLDREVDFNIPAEALSPALIAFSAQADVQVITKTTDISHSLTRGVSGRMAVSAGLKALLTGTNFSYLLVGDKTVEITLGRVAPSATAARTHFDIAAQGLDKALKDFGVQSGLTVVAPSTLTDGKKSSTVHGDLTPTDALGRLLKGSGLTFARVADGTIAIQAFANNGPVQASGRESGPDKELATPTGLAEILVKGSRIMNVDVTRTEDDAQPYYVFDSTTIEQSGAADVEDFLKQRLTMNTMASSNAQIYGNQQGATSAINLRGLGTNETLILIDGRRSAAVAYQGAAGQPDLNGIPLSAIERIEVLPSSASAIYGGAALGGVVNIILKKNFQGGNVKVNYENTTSADAPLRTLTATYGFSPDEGKTQVMLAGHYADGDTLLTQDRLNLVQRGISTILQNSPSFLYNSSSPFAGATTNIAGVDANGNPTNLVLRTGTRLNSPITFIPSGAAPGSNISTALLANAGTYNLNVAAGTGAFGLQNTIGTVPLDKSIMATVRRELSSEIELFTEFSTRSDASRTLYDPFSGGWSVPSSAPDNPFQENVLVAFPNTISAPVTTDNVTQSVTAGLLGRLPGEWKSELDYTWSSDSFEFARFNSDQTALSSALAAGIVNPFADTIAYPLKLAAYLAPETFGSRSTLNDLALRASGPIGSFTWGAPTLTVGIEHRKEGTDNSNDLQLFPLTPSSYTHILSFGESQATNSAYAEANIPLVAERSAVPLLRSLVLQLAGRSENYTVFAGTPDVFLAPNGAPLLSASPPQGEHVTIKYTSTNPTVGLKYQPVDDVIFRTSYARAFLPPSADQFLPDPKPECGFPCTPIIDPRNGQTYDVDISGGGNPNLKPQTSRSWDIGVIFEPKEQALRGLRLDIEYYRITQPDYITTPSAQQIVSNPIYASRVTRNSTTGLITLVNTSPVNAIEYKTDGWDLKFDYRKPTSAGTFDLYVLGTVIEHDLRQYTIGGPFLNYVGYPGEGGEAKTKANATLSWEYRRWRLGWTTTYFGSYLQVFGSPGSPYALQNGAYYGVTDAQGGFIIPSQMYHEIFGSYSFGTRDGVQRSGIARNLLSSLTIQFGIKNLFNTLPPFDAFVTPYYYSQYGDPRLRDYWISVSKGFK